MISFDNVVILRSYWKQFLYHITARSHWTLLWSRNRKHSRYSISGSSLWVFTSHDPWVRKQGFSSPLKLWSRNYTALGHMAIGWSRMKHVNPSCCGQYSFSLRASDRVRDSGKLNLILSQRQQRGVYHIFVNDVLSPQISKCPICLLDCLFFFWISQVAACSSVFGI